VGAGASSHSQRTCSSSSYRSSVCSTASGTSDATAASVGAGASTPDTYSHLRSTARCRLWQSPPKTASVSGLAVGVLTDGQVGVAPYLAFRYNLYNAQLAALNSLIR
jgi:hypothetical protein